MKDKHKGLLLHLATCKEQFTPTEEQAEALREGYKLARHNKQAFKTSFFWKVGMGAVLFLKRDDAVIVKKVPRRSIAAWQKIQNKRKK